jgi:hypothetical protein
MHATDHVTIVKTKLNPRDDPSTRPHMLKAGSLVFSPPDYLVYLEDWIQWLDFVSSTNWRQPNGLGSSMKELDEHPVVHAAYPDAEVYARWVRKEGDPSDTEEMGPLPGNATWTGTRPYTRRGKRTAWVVSGLIFAGNSRAMLSRRDISCAPNVSST